MEINGTAMLPTAEISVVVKQKFARIWIMVV